MTGSSYGCHLIAGTFLEEWLLLTMDFRKTDEHDVVFDTYMGKQLGQTM
jgi:hypothetical protein